MKQLRGTASTILFLPVALSIWVNSQTSPVSVVTPGGVLEVKVKTDKSNYTEGELVHFTALLTNKGHSSLYIAKSFFESGGGIAGFSISVKQLTGKHSGVGCASVADRFAQDDPRAPKQILQEDYMLLPPGSIVGYEDYYHGCDVAHPGIYEMTATYCPCDLNISKVKLVADQFNLIVAESVTSKPWTFYIRERHRGKQ
jgi:hypothetical protein